jgi:hypothetical protein
MALGLTQSLVKMSTRNISWRLRRPHHLQVPNVMKSGSLNLLEPSGPHRACYGTALHLPFGVITSQIKQIKHNPLILMLKLAMTVLLLLLLLLLLLISTS